MHHKSVWSHHQRPWEMFGNRNPTKVEQATARHNRCKSEKHGSISVKLQTHWQKYSRPSRRHTRRTDPRPSRGSHPCPQYLYTAQGSLIVCLQDPPPPCCERSRGDLSPKQTTIGCGARSPQVAFPRLREWNSTTCSSHPIGGASCPTTDVLAVCSS